MLKALKKWDPGKDRPGNHPPGKTSISPKSKINLKSLTQSMRKEKEVEVKRKTKMSNQQKKRIMTQPNRRKWIPMA